MSGKSTEKNETKDAKAVAGAVSKTGPVNDTLVGMDTQIGDVRVGKRDELAGGKAAVETTTLVEPGTVDMTHAGDTAPGAEVEGIPKSGKVRVRVNHFSNVEGEVFSPGDVITVSPERAKELVAARGGVFMPGQPETADEKLGLREERLIRE